MGNHPRLILAGLSGGSGKTILSLGLCRSWTQRGLRVKPFKKGPDYIDAAWLALATGGSTTNLDPFLMSPEVLKTLFLEKIQGSDIAVIEGNRGLHDGKDESGSCSTAQLAKLLHTPVVLIVNCTKMTRTVAALVQGVAAFDSEVTIAGVVFNLTAGERHRSILRRSVEKYTDIPVLGALPRLRQNPIPERHMGLISDREFSADQALDTLAATIAEWVDVEGIKSIAARCGKLPQRPPESQPRARPMGTPVRIGVVKDAALWFYYQENLEALEQAGAELVEVSLLTDSPWPELHGLYLGGGFPETQAEELSRNVYARSMVKELAGQGLPIYAECGGLMYLCESLAWEGYTYPMAGVFPVKTRLNKKPQGHGYTRARVVHPNPFLPVGTEFTGHEFHYSSCHPLNGEPLDYCLHMGRGHGMHEQMDGLVARNTFACYTHLHARGVPSWARDFVRAARRYQQVREANTTDICPFIRAE